MIIINLYFERLVNFSEFQIKLIEKDSFDFTNTYVTQISFVYTSGSTVLPGTDPTQQFLWFDNITCC